MKYRHKPMLAKEADKPFSDKDWIFEIKWDGFRALAYINEKVSLRSRNNKELIDNFPELKELGQLTQNVVLDGEIVVIRNGQPDFQALQERGKAEKQSEISNYSLRQPAQFVVFDILEKNGQPLTKLTLLERKGILKESMKEGKHVVLSDFVEEKGETYYKIALNKGLEGIIAKQKKSLYQEGLRTGKWLKIKRLQSCDCVIFGCTKGTGARSKTFGALILGLYKDTTPVFIGKVGTGFNQTTLEELCKAFEPFKTENPAFKTGLHEEITWLKPKLVCEIHYQTITNDLRLRMPRFRGLRKDKAPQECTIEQLNLSASVLKEYAAKRDFAETPEPSGEQKSTEKQVFVVQEHHSRRLHYDFRLENSGVLKSWAVPKGIPETVDEKRLAVQTEDHPIEYAKFEGEIPAGQYGAGMVKIWDKGTFVTKAWDDNIVEVTLNGERLKGRYVLVRLKKAGEKSWLLLKGRD